MLHWPDTGGCFGISELADRLVLTKPDFFDGSF